MPLLPYCLELNKPQPIETASSLSTAASTSQVDSLETFRDLISNVSILVQCVLLAAWVVHGEVRGLGRTGLCRLRDWHIVRVKLQRLFRTSHTVLQTRQWSASLL